MAPPILVAQPLHVVVDGSSGISAADAALLGAVIAGVASLLTAILTTFLANLWQREREGKQESAASRAARAARITDQLSGLYGPLRMLVSQSAALAEKMREGKPEPENWHLLHNLAVVVANPADEAIVEQIIEINGQIEQLVLTKAGLLQDGTVPDSFVAFLGHFRQLTIAFEAATQTGEVPEEIIAKQFESYPREFDTDVVSGYEALRSERAALGL